MPNTTDTKVTKENTFSTILHEIRAVQEELLYASYYNEEAEFKNLLKRLRDKYWNLYDIDQQPK